MLRLPVRTYHYVDIVNVIKTQYDFVFRKWIFSVRPNCIAYSGVVTTLLLNRCVTSNSVVAKIHDGGCRHLGVRRNVAISLKWRNVVDKLRVRWRAHLWRLKCKIDYNSRWQLPPIWISKNCCGFLAIQPSVNLVYMLNDLDAEYVSDIGTDVTTKSNMAVSAILTFKNRCYPKIFIRCCGYVRRVRWKTMWFHTKW